MPDENKFKVLVCPLDWGWGHAARMIPVIQTLREYNFQVVLGLSGDSGELLKEEFPELPFIKLVSKNIRYSKRKSQVFSIFWQLPGLIYTVYKENRQLKKILSQQHFDLVISDNRYGLWNSSVYSIFITHQLWIKFPSGLKWLEGIFNYIQNRLLCKFSECWVPDDREHYNLSGELSLIRSKELKTHEIGLLSRFKENGNTSDNAEKRYDVLVLLSGPEPQRSIFENIVEKQIRETGLKVCFILGTRRRKIIQNSEKVEFVN